MTMQQDRETHVFSQSWVFSAASLSRRREKLVSCCKSSAMFDVEFPLAGEHFIAGLVVFCPEAQRHRACAYTQVMQGDVWEPVRQNRIYIKSFVVRVSVQSKNRPQEVKHTTCCPGLRHIGSQVLHRECARLSPRSCIQFREPIESEVARSLADVTSDHGRFLRETVTLESHGDDAIVVRPDGSVLIGERIVRGIAGREGSDAPTTPHVRFHKACHNASSTFGAHNAAPQ